MEQPPRHADHPDLIAVLTKRFQITSLDDLKPHGFKASVGVCTFCPTRDCQPVFGQVDKPCSASVALGVDTVDGVAGAIWMPVHVMVALKVSGLLT